MPEINSSDEESEGLDLEEESYKGPMTHSRTKGTTTQTVDIVTKANHEMEQYLGITTKSQDVRF